MSKQTFTGTITSLTEIEQEDYYADSKYCQPNTKDLTISYKVELTLDDDTRVWFYTPSCKFFVAYASSIIIKNFLPKKSWNWGTITKDEIVTKDGAFEKYTSHTETCTPNIAIGDRISVSGRIKKQYAYGNVSINYVKLVK